MAKLLFFQTHACVTEGSFFVVSTKICEKEISSSCSESDFKTTSLKYWKKWKTNVWCFDLGQRKKTLIFQKMHAHAIRGNFFFFLLPNDAEGKVL